MTNACFQRLGEHSKMKVNCSPWMLCGTRLILSKKVRTALFQPEVIEDMICTGGNWQEACDPGIRSHRGVFARPFQRNRPTRTA